MKYPNIKWEIIFLDVPFKFSFFKLLNLKEKRVMVISIEVDTNISTHGFKKQRNIKH